MISLHAINKRYADKCIDSDEVCLRKFPYPFKAALTICNDIDKTATLEEFLEISNFINTKEQTSMGKGIGLPIGNSFFFYEPPNMAITYFSEDSKIPDTINKFIKNGRIDSIHSYGKKYDFTRQDAIVALSALKKNNLKLDVWIDHTLSIDNMGDDVTFGFGDHPDSDAYHSDLTLDYGIKFAWFGRVTMIAGQSVPITFSSFSSIFDREHTFNSFVNISKEFVKNALGMLGNEKYALHYGNDLLQIVELDDGRKLYEFMRFDNHWSGVGNGANSKGLAYSISKKTLNRLKKVGGYMIVYTHFGMNSDCAPQFICTETQNALRVLANEFETGNIFVTNTSKMLKYYLVHKYLEWSYENNDESSIVYIKKVNDPVFGEFIPTVEDLEGLTFYVKDANNASIYLNNKIVTHFKKNAADQTGKQSITITNR